MATDAATVVPLQVHTTPCPGRARHHEPVTVGIPLPLGFISRADELTLADETGTLQPLQAQVRERWRDGSVRWVHLDFQVDGPVRASRRFTLARGDAAPAPWASISLATRGTQLAVDTGVRQFVVGSGTSWIMETQGARGARPPVEATHTTLRVIDARGREHPLLVDHVVVEHQGPLRVTLRLDGILGSRRRPFVEMRARLEFFAGSAAVRLALTLCNPRRAVHRGGIWELGDAGSVYIRDATLRLSGGSSPEWVDFSPDPGTPATRTALPLELYQDSSGGDHWNHVTHVNRHGQVPCRMRGFRLQAGDEISHGSRATPALVTHHAQGCAGVVIEHFWQNFPKAVSADGDRVAVALFPPQFGDVHELQGGEQKTHRLTLLYGDDSMARDAMFWGRVPTLVSAEPAWYAACRAVDYLVPESDDTDARYRQLVTAAIDGDDSLAQKRERVDEYGWRHFGDLYADHENAFSGETVPIVSHYNNQYDAIGGLACQFMRTADRRWFTLMSELAAHVSDIDVYHTTKDKAAYNHGLFWHTAHYVPAGRSTHRSFPRHPRVHGGGPANEHNYSAGLRLHWLLTGDQLSRETAIGLADWVLAMDDGRRTPFRWLASGDSGLASHTYEPSFHGPGRGAGHSILALLDGHRLTGERRYLDKAEHLIRRCIHPSDDPDALQLLDAERRWSYVVFLQAVCRYLDHKADRDERDAAYAYARAALLRYARWMAACEYPYLDTPEILEFPTETWAAQDLRKAEVLLYAAGHATGDERDRFIERGRFFYDDSLTRLSAATTRTLTRPLVLLLSFGFMPMSARITDPRPEPRAAVPQVSPTRFTPQKARARARLISAAAVVLFAGAALAMWLLDPPVLAF